MALWFNPAHADDGRYGAASTQTVSDDEDGVDPETVEAVWNRLNRETFQPYLRDIAATGHSRDLLAAAMLWPVFDSLVPTEPANHAAANKPLSQEALAWAQAARRINPRDPVIAWIDAAGCAGQDATCDSRAALQVLLQEEPDNAAALMLAIADAENSGDSMALRQHWKAVGNTTRYDTHALEISRLLHATLQNADWPPLDATLAEFMGGMLSLDRPATHQELANAAINAALVRLSWPDLAAVSNQCKSDRYLPAERRLQCTHVLELMAENDTHLITPLLGLSLLIRSAGDVPKASAWCESLRQLYWVYENASPPRPFETGEVSLTDYYTWFVTEGELFAMRRLLELRGLSATAPADWLPSNERRRALVTTGRAP